MLVTHEILRRGAGSVNSQALALCEGFGDKELKHRSNPRKWSIAENLIHLRRTTETFLPWADHAIAETRGRGMLSDGPYPLGAYGSILVWYVEPPPVIRLPAPAALMPLLSGSLAGALPAFLESQQWMLQRMDESAGLDLTALRFGSPLAKYVRMNLLEFFCVFNGHSRRHIWQAENVRRQILAGKVLEND
jgi:hypothetical protein